MINRLFQLSIASSVLMLLSFAGYAPQQDMYSSLESAIAVGNAERLSDFMNTSVELEMPGQEEEIYSKSQALIVLAKFFDSHPPASFNFTYKGSSGVGNRVAIGNYLSTDDTSYRIKIIMKKVGSKYVIQEMEFE